MEIYCEPYKCFWLELVKGHKRFLKAIVTSWVYLSSLKDEKLISVKNPSQDVRHGDNLEWGKLKDVLSACTWLGRGRHQSQKWFLERCMIKIVWTLNYNEHSLGNPCQISIGGLLVMAQAQWWGHFLKLFGVISMFHEFGYKCQVRDLFEYDLTPIPLSCCVIWRKVWVLNKDLTPIPLSCCVDTGKLGEVEDFQVSKCSVDHRGVYPSFTGRVERGCFLGASSLFRNEIPLSVIRFLLLIKKKDKEKSKSKSDFSWLMCIKGNKEPIDCLLLWNYLFWPVGIIWVACRGQTLIL